MARGVSGNGNGLGPSGEAVRAELEKILAHHSFAQSEQLTRFLRFIVEKTLEGQGGQLKEYSLGIEVFRRDTSYDSRTDPVVRVQARRLRAKLNGYYENAGRDDEVRIELPKPGYVPVFLAGSSPPQRGRSAHSRLLRMAEAFWYGRSAAPERRRAKLWLIAGAAAVLLAIAASTALVANRRRATTQPATALPSIAVLPFVDLSRGGENEYLGDGLADEITGALAKLKGLRVVARTSAFRFKGRNEDIRQIGRQLNVNAVLEGSVAKNGDRLRVTAQLINAGDGYHLWSETYERPAKDLFAVQNEITRGIVEALRVELAGHGAGWIRKQPTANLEAYNLYLKGRYFWEKRNPEAIQRAIQSFEQAAQQDPGFALAYAGLADCYAVRASWNKDPLQDLAQKTKQAAEKASSLDDSLAEPHAALGLVEPAFDWDWSASDRHFQRALELNPAYATAHHWYGLSLLIRGRFREAENQLRKALDLNPLSLMILTNLGDLFFYERRYDQAIEQYRKAIEIDPQWALGHSMIARALFFKGLPAEAIPEIRIFLEANPGDVAARMGLARCYLATGRKEEAARLIAVVKQSYQSQYVAPNLKAAFYSALGEKDLALGELEQVYQQHADLLPSIKVDPEFASLQSDPRFAALIQKMKL